MIATVTLNPALDKVYRVNKLNLNGVNRVLDVSAAPGGKGINVARVAHLLGAPVVATGFLGGAAGRIILESIGARGIMADFINIRGDSRETITIIDEAARTQTELLEPGPIVRENEVYSMTGKVSELACKSGVVCFSGSLPGGLAPDYYATLVRAAKAAGAVTMLDTSGQYLSSGLKGAPFFSKPNLDELEQWLGHRPGTIDEVVKAGQRILELGVKLAVVTLGKEGSVAVTENSVWRVESPAVRAVNTVGCGDALVAGCAVHFSSLQAEPGEDDIETALILGTAAAASNALNFSAGDVRPEEVDSLLKKVVVERKKAPF
ncbi:1-phosphofructokinase [Desulfocucumis palustris]|uniref:Tagatose-6-phosphate kinase n=1 Tax=Desulfocucumis palustris TaxID=1898651 RepID=A0A2L2XD46_9FIRM|nr:1-phosphofructokinase family hexose kinase [Desulfocucumis palustris]GBF34269.1 1-phosphofructokinase [Desulfocucumis palustris]